MIDIDTRIKSLPRPDERSAVYEIRAELVDIKKLVRDVLSEVSPERDNMTIPPGAHNSYGAGEKHGWNGAIDEMQSKIREIGL